MFSWKHLNFLFLKFSALQDQAVPHMTGWDDTYSLLFLWCVFLDKSRNLNCSNDASLSPWPVSTVLTLLIRSTTTTLLRKKNTTHLPLLQAKSVFLGYFYTRNSWVWQFNECPDAEITFSPTIRAFIKLLISTLSLHLLKGNFWCLSTNTNHQVLFDWIFVSTEARLETHQGVC